MPVVKNNGDGTFSLEVQRAKKFRNIPTRSQRRKFSYKFLCIVFKIKKYIVCFQI